MLEGLEDCITGDSVGLIVEGLEEGPAGDFVGLMAEGIEEGNAVSPSSSVPSDGATDGSVVPCVDDDGVWVNAGIGILVLCSSSSIPTKSCPFLSFDLLTINNDPRLTPTAIEMNASRIYDHSL